ncbi:hypothetical protein TRIUR3_33910 [Triticum urartu]|uniref:Uncharacterized protein n=1 Tax=Triticum urartu TaxID=4572 RepID=M7YE33_TRIUA|nr:hypothetical protein TRIUR3_33910 [Triticum urartu]
MSPDVSALVQTVPVNAWLARLRVVPVAKKAVSLPETATLAAALERLEERIGELESGSEKVRGHVVHDVCDPSWHPAWHMYQPGSTDGCAKRERSCGPTRTSVSLSGGVCDSLAY